MTTLKPKENFISENKNTDIKNEIKKGVYNLLNFEDKFNNIYKYVKNQEKITKGIIYNEKTIRKFLEKYPEFLEKDFINIFFGNIYNSFILIFSPDILDIFDFKNLKAGDDLMEILIDNIGISEKEFYEKAEKIIPNKISFPLCSSLDIAQNNFYSKISQILYKQKIILGDNPEIKNNKGSNEIKTDSIGFWLYKDSYLNLCILKLLKTNPDKEKLEELNKKFYTYNKVFIGGSTEGIPFNINNLGFKNLIFSRHSNNNGQIEIKGNQVINSMGYLNSAYYLENVSGVFISQDHNIMEPLHALRPTINNFLNNRYNHNWLASYFGEKYGLLLILDPNSSFKENQEKINTFLSISENELKEKQDEFKKIIDGKMKNFVYGMLINFFEERFKMNIGKNYF